MTGTAERLAVVNTALIKEDEVVSRDMIERFAGCAQFYLANISVLILLSLLIDNVLELNKMSKRATWKKILESEEDKKKIGEIFKQIDEHTKNFYVRSPTYLIQSRFSCSVAQLKLMLTIERNTRGLRDLLAVRFLGNLMIGNEV